MPTDRSQPDACPGALQVHHAADGALARVRLPGGLLTPTQLQTLADAARDLGNGQMELTSRGNVQLRSVSDPRSLRIANRFGRACCRPRRTSECATSSRPHCPAVSEASPTFVNWFTVSIRRSKRIKHWQICQGEPCSPSTTGAETSAGFGAISDSTHSAPPSIHWCSPVTTPLIVYRRDDAVELLLAAARSFLDVRDKHWRLAEVPDGIERTLEQLGLSAESTVAADLTPDARPTIGWLEQRDGTVALGGGLRFGLLDARLAEFLAAVDKPVVVTPWRSVHIFDLDEWAAEQVVRVLAPMGLIFDENSPWLEVTACTGSPGCEKSLADVRTDAITAVEQAELPVVGRQHWAGCDRSCGRPRGDVADVIATGDGYRVNPADR